MKKWYQTMSGLLAFVGWLCLLAAVWIKADWMVIVVCAVYGVVGTVLMIVNTRMPGNTTPSHKVIKASKKPPGPTKAQSKTDRVATKRQGGTLISTGPRIQRHLH